MRTIKTIVRDANNGSVTAEQNVRQALDAIAAHRDLNAVLSTCEERAMKRAEAIDQAIQSGETAGPLAGVVFMAKDNFLSHGSPTTAASKMLEHFTAPLQAEAIERLEAAGAICVGKTNLDAFAHGGSTENSAFGPTKNVHDNTRVAGGSSGGSAAVVAAGIVPFALGTDTGGSIRQPASFNGVYGIKPTYGAVSRFGVVAMASSTDTIGCFAATAEDTAAVMAVMAGRDEKDMTTLPDYFVPTTEVKPGLKIGIIKETMNDDVDEDVRKVTQDYVARLRALGHTVDEVSMPTAPLALAMYYIIVPAEVCSNLARYDGVRYGRRAEGVQTLAELYGKSRDEGFVTENKRRIMIGSYVLSSGFFDAYYLQAQKARTLLIQEFNALFKIYDFLLTPTAPTPAFGIGDNISDPVKMYLADVMTVPASLAGIPAMNVPAGANKGGLPIGVQLIGPMKSDAALIALAGQVERANG